MISNDDEVLAKVKGTGGIVYVFSDRVVISRKSITVFFGQGIKGDKTIYFKDIKAIEYKKPTVWANGYIQFIANMELATNQTVEILGTALKALKDPNAVILRAIKKEVVQNVEAVYQVAVQQWKNSKVEKQKHPLLDPADEIAKYKKLLDDGTITKEEFEAKKKQLLNL